ncbi:hypothetical protein [Bdellovibrio sp. HCB337]|uniref:hypothetical protein n=1 Tax=Bdellovibrio sp. HCB337 TaxID=3394358 RepID=UPI0039A54CAB
MRILLFAALCILTAACGSTPKQIESPLMREKTTMPSEPVDTSAPSVDYIGLQRALGMEIPTNNLGYKEKVFNTCEAGYGYSSTHNCHREYMVVINIQLQCRDSVGQVSEGVNNADLSPIASKTVKWNLKGTQGTSQTDFDGFAQIMTVSNMSQKQQRLKLAVGNEFLYMRANEITRVVTPRNWCEQ